MIDISDVRQALNHGDFFLEYLPTVSLSDGRCIGGEALIRWRLPTRVMPPIEFVPQIENTPASGLVTYWVIDTVADQLQAWLRQTPDAHVSINVPPEILGRGGMEYVATRAGLLDQASQVVLEITERGVPDPLGVMALAQGQGKGIKVALDDVTLVGGANLAILARCNLHAIKLDKSLIDQIRPGSPAPEWLNSVKILLEMSQLQVVAEGVENFEQTRILREANIQFAQGFCFSPPIPAAAFMAFYRDWRLPSGVGEA